MYTSKIEYLGELRTEATHLQSGNQIITDAPTDNHGKGEAFSPTDLVATALASCMISIMGIKLQGSGKDIKGATSEVTKVMYSEPRRIGEIHVKISVPDNNFSERKSKF
jgi:putative redox protein